MGGAGMEGVLSHLIIISYNIIHQMIRLNSTILIQDVNYGVIGLWADLNHTIQTLQAKLYDVITTDEQEMIKVETYYRGYKTDKQCKVGELFDQGDDVIVKIQKYDVIEEIQDIKQVPKLDYQENINIRNKNRKNRKKRNKRKKIKKKNISQWITQSSLNNENQFKKTRSVVSQQTFNKLIQLIDNYLLFALEHRKKQYQNILNIKRYFVDKYGCTLQSLVLQQIVQICPSLYQTKRIKNYGTMIKLKQFTNTAQRINNFNKCFLQFQNKQIHYLNIQCTQSKNISMKHQQRKRLDQKAVFYDPNFSQNLRKFVQQKQMLIQQEKKKSNKEETIGQYLSILEQIQLFKILRRTNPTKQIFYEQILKRIDSTEKAVEQLVQFLSQKTRYIQCVVSKSIVKIIINIQLFQEAKRAINKM